MPMFSPTASRWAGVVRRAAPNWGGLHRMFFSPEIATFSGQTSIAFDRFGFSERTLSKLVHWELDGTAVGYRTGSTVLIEPAYVKEDSPVPIRQTFERVPGLEAPGQNLSAAARREFIIAQMMLNAEQRLRNLLEVMAAEALVHGRVTLESPSFPRRTLNFNRPAADSVIVATPWADESARPLDDLTPIKQRKAEEAGYDCKVLVMGATAFGGFTKSKQVKEIRSAKLAQRFVTDIEPKTLRGLQYQFSTEEFDVWTYYGTHVNDAKQVVHNMPQNGLVMLDPEMLMGRTGFGAIMHDEAGNEPIEADMFHNVYRSGDGGRRTNVSSDAAPIVFPMDIDASAWVQTN